MERTILVNDISYRLESVTGQVLAPTKSMETSVQGSASGGGGLLYKGTGKVDGVDLKLVSTTTVHDQFFLVDETGHEHAFQLQGFNVACREGNSLTVVAAFAPGQARGPYVAVHNNTTQTRFINDSAISSLCAPGLLRYLLICLGAMLLEYKLLSGFLLVTGCLAATVFATLVAYYIKSESNSQEFKKQL